MASTSVLTLLALFACQSGVLGSSDGPLPDPAPVRELVQPVHHVGDNCYLDCWKTPGFCDWCGRGNACCNAGNNGPHECQGTVKASDDRPEQFRCVKAASAPTSQSQCSQYMRDTGCGWTSEYNCPGQPAGSKGFAGDQVSLGYKCCCEQEMWKSLGPDAVHVDHRSVAGEANDPHAFNVDHPMDDRHAGEPLINEHQDAGFQLHVATGQQRGNNVASNRNPKFLDNHKGGNFRIDQVAHVNPDSPNTKHHGPIHNSFSRNDQQAKRERCVAGICSDLGDSSTDLQQTEHNVPVAATENPQVLPSYEVTMGENDEEPKITKLVPGSTQAAAPPPSALGIQAREAVSPGVEPNSVDAVPTPVVAAQAFVPPAAPLPATAPPTEVLSSGAYGAIAALTIICLVCVCGGAAAVFVLLGRKKKRARSTEREAYLKSDFVERQPLYHSDPEEVVAPMMREKVEIDMEVENARSQPVEGILQTTHDMFPVANPVNLIPSVPVQVPPPTHPSDVAVSFPGMPAIGGTAFQSTTAPIAASGKANMNLPYGGYRLGAASSLTTFR